MKEKFLLKIRTIFVPVRCANFLILGLISLLIFKVLIAKGLVKDRRGKLEKGGRAQNVLIDAMVVKGIKFCK